MKITEAEEDDIILCTIKDGEIRQLGLNKSQRKVLRATVVALSENKPLVLLGEDYNLTLKRLK